VSYIVIDAPQRSPEWLQARVGRLTGTAALHLLDVLKDGKTPGYKRRDLLARLVCERLTNAPQENGYVNAEMQRGIDKEPDAIAAYEAQSGLVVRSTGFLQHPTLLAGCSLDGHVGDMEGICEFKCPKSATHLYTLRIGRVPDDNLPQVRHNLWISEADWCDWASFDDRFPPHLSFFCTRVWRKDADIPGYERIALAFLDEVQREYDAVRTMTNLSGVLAEAVQS